VYSCPVCQPAGSVGPSPTAALGGRPEPLDLR
jgi:hypothetical protein